MADNSDFLKIGRATNKDILAAVKDIVDNCEFLTKIEKVEHYDFDGAAKTTISFSYLTRRDRE